jgi:transposase
MMGVAQKPLFYEFSLERQVPTDHLLRSIDQFVDLSGLREQLRPFYSETRRPSVDPELLIRILIIGYTHDRAHSRRSRHLAAQADRRYRLRLGRDARLAVSGEPVLRCFSNRPQAAHDGR